MIQKMVSVPLDGRNYKCKKKASDFNWPRFINHDKVKASRNQIMDNAWNAMEDHDTREEALAAILDINLESGYVHGEHLQVCFEEVYLMKKVGRAVEGRSKNTAMALLEAGNEAPATRKRNVSQAGLGQ
jgi:hypothetical protein